ncbi:MAG: hypothetical protein ABNH31_07875 [Glaciecola sp.]
MTDNIAQIQINNAIDTLFSHNITIMSWTVVMSRSSALALMFELVNGTSLLITL